MRKRKIQYKIKVDGTANRAQTHDAAKILTGDNKDLKFETDSSECSRPKRDSPIRSCGIALNIVVNSGKMNLGDIQGELQGCHCKIHGLIEGNVQVEDPCRHDTENRGDRDWIETDGYTQRSTQREFRRRRSGLTMEISNLMIRLRYFTRQCRFDGLYDLALQKRHVEEIR